MFALQTKLIQWHAQWSHIWFVCYNQVAAICVCHILFVAAKGIQCRLWLDTRYLAVDHRILAPIDKCIFACLVARDSELSIYIVLELMIVAIQVVRRDIQQDSNVCLEIVAVVQLEG